MKSKYLRTILQLCMLIKVGLLLATMIWLAVNSPAYTLWLFLCIFITFFSVHMVVEIRNFICASFEEIDVLGHIKFSNGLFGALGFLLPFCSLQHLNGKNELWLTVILALFFALDFSYYSLIGSKYVLIKKRWPVLYNRLEVEIKMTSDGKLVSIEKKKNEKILFQK